MKPGDPRTLMWSRALEALSEVERLQKQFFHPGPATTMRPVWEPPVDIFEADGDLDIVVALPGVTFGQLEVRWEGGVLVISGELPVSWQGRNGTIRRMEIPHGFFERRLEGLPPGLKATRKEVCDGCLLLTFRKRE